MATVDKLIVRIEADLKDLKKGLRESSRATKHSATMMNKHFARVGTQVRGVSRALFSLKGALVGLGAGAAVRSLIKVGNDVESLQIRFKTLFGSAEEGSKAFDTMAQFASKVPFSLEQIQAGSGSLLAVADNAEELGELLEMTGTIAAATGLDFRTASEQIQRSLSAGIGAADLFRDRGVTAMLGFTAGTKVSLEETKEALQQFAKDNDGITDELANTFSGTLSMIGDKVFSFQRKINDAGFFAELTSRFKELDNFLINNAEQMDALAKNISDMLVVALDGLVSVTKLVAENFDSIVRVAKAFILLKLGSVIVTLSAGFAILAANIIKTKGAMLALNRASRKNIFALMAVGLVIAAEKAGLLEDALKAVDKAMAKVSGLFGRGEDLGLGPFGPPDNPKRLVPIGVDSSPLTTRDKMLFGHHTTPDVNFDRGGQVSPDKPLFSREAQNRQLEINTELLKMQENARITANNEIQRAIELEKELETQLQNEANLLSELGILIPDYTEEFKLLDQALEAGRITQEQYNEAVGALNIKLAEAQPQIRVFMEGLDRTMESLSQTMADSLMNMGEGWKGFRDALKGIIRDIIAQLIKLQMQQMLTKAMGVGGGGGGSLGNIFSSISGFFGGGGGATSSYTGYGVRQGGGAVSARSPYVVGESGPELFVPHTAGSIRPNSTLGTSGGGGIVVNQTLSFDVGVAQTVRTEIRQLMPQIQQSTIGALMDAKQRGGQVAEVFK